MRIIQNKSKVLYEKVKDGTRSGTGKIVCAHWDELTVCHFWGRFPSTQALQFGIESSSAGALSTGGLDTEFSCETNVADCAPYSEEGISCVEEARSCTP